MKTAAIILNHNLPEYTDMLYEDLKPYEAKKYDLFVFDNGSSDSGISKYTTHRIENNVYYGGGFNAGMQFVLSEPQYDSMLFLNNDLTIHGYNFVDTLRAEMYMNFTIEPTPLPKGPEPVLDIVSPCFYNIEPRGQCHWKTMHNYGNMAPRIVPFIDFQCPLISRRLMEEVKEIDPSLIYGWGIDALFAITCKKKGWPMGVVDRACVLHHNSLTVKMGVAGLDIKTYCHRAEQGQAEFFSKTNMAEDFRNIRKEAEQYDGTT